MKEYPTKEGEAFQMEMLPKENRDQALGRYMGAFSNLEGMIHLAIADIMEINLPKLRPVFAVLMTKQSIDLLEAVGQIHLCEEGSARVKKICERLSRRNMRRNHIVHGSWTQECVVYDEKVTAEWVRGYAHAKPDMDKLSYSDPKLLGMYSFTIPELDKASDHVEEMNTVISQLLQDLPRLKSPQ